MVLESPKLAAVILPAGFAILLLNNGPEPGEPGREPKPGGRRSPAKLENLIAWSLTGAIVLIGVTLAPRYPSLTWIIPLGLVALGLGLIAFFLRRLIWIYVKALCQGKKAPRIVTKGEDGTLTAKCPKCSAKVIVHPGKEGDLAWKCEYCGEEAKWETPLEP